MSAMARAIRPLPSSNGWMVTNQRCARPAFRTGSMSAFSLNHARKACMSPSRRAAFVVAVRGLEPSYIHAKATGNRRPDLCGIELLAFDLAALEHVGGQRLQHGFLAEVEPEGFHVADQLRVPVAP